MSQQFRDQQQIVRGLVHARGVPVAQRVRPPTVRQQPAPGGGTHTIFRRVPATGRGTANRARPLSASPGLPLTGTMRCLSPLPRTISDGPASPSEHVARVDGRDFGQSQPGFGTEAQHEPFHIVRGAHGSIVRHVWYGRDAAASCAPSAARRPDRPRAGPWHAATGKNRRACFGSPCASPPSMIARRSNALDPPTSRHRAIYPGTAPRGLSCTAAC